MSSRVRRSTVMLSIVALVGIGAALVPTAAGAVAVGDEAAFRLAWENAATTQVDLTADITLTCPDGASDRNSATPITLDGNGFSITQSCASQRVLGATGGGAVELRNLTITGGSAPGDAGGGLYADTPLTITNSTFSGNSSDNGGALYATGTTTITSSTFRDNSAVAGFGNGGAIQIASTGSLTVINSTISNNTATNAGGGITTAGAPVTLVYATVVDNTGSSGANLEMGGSGDSKGTLTSFGSVVALPRGGGTNCAEVTTSSDGYNVSDDASCGFTAGTDLQGSGDPGLGQLAANGGPTQTRLPGAGSPLLDRIPASACQSGVAVGIAQDQRGLTRPGAAGCDVGSVEVQPPPPADPAVVTPTFTG